MPWTEEQLEEKARLEYLELTRKFLKLQGAYARLKERRGSLLAIDVEAWERNSAYITEVGWTVVSWSEGPDQEHRETTHASTVFCSLRSPHLQGVLG
jgi:hypothetical protein